MHFENHTLPWIGKILSKCTFLIQIYPLQSYGRSEATPAEDQVPAYVPIQAWVSLCTLASPVQCPLTNIDILLTMKIAFVWGIPCFWKYGSPKFVTKPVFMKRMRLHDRCNQELRTQKHRRPCPAIFNQTVDIRRPAWAYKITPSSLPRAIPRAQLYLLSLSLGRCTNTPGHT